MKSSRHLFRSLHPAGGLLAAALALTSPSLAPAQDAMMAAKIEIRAVKSIQVRQAAGRYVADVKVIFANANPYQVRLDNAQFQVQLSGQRQVEMGRGTVNGQLLEKGAAAPAVTEAVIPVDMGSNNDPATTERLIALFNMIGSPQATKTLKLKGDCDFAVQVNRGWVTSRSVAVEFDFKPRLQNEVLFE